MFFQLVATRCPRTSRKYADKCMPRQPISSTVALALRCTHESSNRAYRWPPRHWRRQSAGHRAWSKCRLSKGCVPFQRQPPGGQTPVLAAAAPPVARHRSSESPRAKPFLRTSFNRVPVYNSSYYRCICSAFAAISGMFAGTEEVEEGRACARRVGVRERPGHAVCSGVVVAKAW